MCSAFFSARSRGRSASRACADPLTSRRVAVLGLGLIGSSLGLALKHQSSPPTIVGFDPNRQASDSARSHHAIDRAAGSASEAIRDADTVILAAPVRGIIELLSTIGSEVAEDVLVTDTGSTKLEIISHAASVFSGRVGFIGGHPLAGRLRIGVAEPDARLFVGSVFCLCPTPDSPAWAVERATDLVEAIGARPQFLDPTEHDALLAGISHLPYFASAALMDAVGSQTGWPGMSALAAGGFRTATSLVDSSTEMWTDVALTNAGPLGRQLDALITVLSALRQMVSEGDAKQIKATLDRANVIHREWVRSREGEQTAPPAQTNPQPSRRFPFLRG
ncbi:MAG: prephenate dehydrogenase/arogenate dehydrogenase family protein [Chloroflexi bacterium]|nr:prephenate dehydrogenase/arogenate dehydrogenase family protein [Chloroflexota bacterium]